MTTFLCLCAVFSSLLGDPHRPQLHLTAPGGWINDPNGLTYRNGEWHCFVQHNPFGTDPTWVAGSTSWLHFVSPDLLHWEPLGDVITPDALGAMASGSAVTDVRNTAGFGTNAHVLVYTALSGPNGGRYGKQCLAYSNDGRTYVKYAGNPVLPAVDGGADRDPRVFWHEDHWVMALYAERGGKCVYDIFTSPNLKDWTLVSEIDSGEKVGARGWLFECAGLEKVKVEEVEEVEKVEEVEEVRGGNVKWVIWGADPRWAQVGDFDGYRFTPTGPKQPTGVLQKGAYTFYAAQVFTDAPDGRTIWVPWFQQSWGKDFALFSQMCGIPEELTLRREGDGFRFVRRPIREFANLRCGAAVPLEAFDGELAEVSLVCTVRKDARLAFDLRGLSLVYDGSAGTLQAGDDAPQPWLVADGHFAVTVFLDRGAAEVFAQDGSAVMPVANVLKDGVKRKLSVTECRGAENCAFTAWTLRSIWERPRLSPDAEDLARSVLHEGNAARLEAVFAKAARGERISIVALGGSITEGAFAGSDANRWGDRVGDWFERMFPAAQVVRHNAGIGATGSKLGVYRMARDVAPAQPDLVLIDFAVNDPVKDHGGETMEGCVRQILRMPSAPAVMLVSMVRRDGSNVQEKHLPVAVHYGLPNISIRDVIAPKVASGEIAWNDYSGDKVHPNAAGHPFAASVVAAFLSRKLADWKAGKRSAPFDFPVRPLYGTTFDNGRIRMPSAVSFRERRGFSKGPSRWRFPDTLAATEPGAKIVFETEATTLSILHWRLRADFGRARVTVDGEPLATLEGWFPETWGGYAEAVEIYRNRTGRHLVEIEVLGDKAPESTGHRFELCAVLEQEVEK